MNLKDQNKIKAEFDRANRIKKYVILCPLSVTLFLIVIITLKFNILNTKIFRRRVLLNSESYNDLGFIRTNKYVFFYPKQFSETKMQSIKHSFSSPNKDSINLSINEDNSINFSDEVCRVIANRIKEEQRKNLDLGEEFVQILNTEYVHNGCNIAVSIELKKKTHLIIKQIIRKRLNSPEFYVLTAGYIEETSKFKELLEKAIDSFIVI